MKVIIAGGGFGGLRLARRLNNRKGIDVLLLDKVNHHQFQPLFYQVATSGLDASNISFPLRKVFHNSKNVRIRLAEILEVHPDENRIVTTLGDMDYDVLVLAMGAGSNFFNNRQLEAHAFPMKSSVEAIRLRHRLLENFEDALQARSAEERQRFMNIVIVGGGPTGVELSGAIADMRRFVLPKDYPELDFKKMNIFLLEGGSRILPTMSEKSSSDSKRYLDRLGVNVMTGAMVSDFDGTIVTLKDGKTIPAAIVVWAAGIRGNAPQGIPADLLVKGNRIKVDPWNRIIGQSNIFVIGDLASMETSEFPQGHPQLAPVAMQQADTLAKNLRQGMDISNWNAFGYHDKGTMATVGRNLAVADIPKPRLHFKGFPAWMIWMGLHLMMILGVKNRLFVFLNWLYSYVTYDQSLRLIFNDFYRSRDNEEAAVEKKEEKAGYHT